VHLLYKHIYIKARLLTRALRKQEFRSWHNAQGPGDDTEASAEAEIRGQGGGRSIYQIKKIEYRRLVPGFTGSGLIFRSVGVVDLLVCARDGVSE
jgi:hypothetical protein